MGDPELEFFRTIACCFDGDKDRLERVLLRLPATRWIYLGSRVHIVVLSNQAYGILRALSRAGYKCSFMEV